MGMTMTQKILAAHADLDHVEAGQLILVNLDRVLGNDITSPVAIREFNKLGMNQVFDRDKVTMVMDHFAPNKDIKAATQCKMCRDFCEEKEVTHFYDVGQMGIEHALLPEKGLVVSGDVVIGADSHTCTYGALGAFSTGVGSTDMACGMAIGKAWFKVPSAIRFVLKGKLNPYISGKDVILHIIGMIGVDGALYRSMEFTGEEKSCPRTCTIPNNIDGTITATLIFHLFFNALSITPLNTISSTNPAAIPVNATPALKVLNISFPFIFEETYSPLNIKT